MLLGACSELASPTRSNAYDWRLIVTFDSLGPQLDTLSFHWPRSRLPVRIYVEDAGGLPDDVSHGIDLWKTGVSVRGMGRQDHQRLEQRGYHRATGAGAAPRAANPRPRVSDPCCCRSVTAPPISILSPPGSSFGSRVRVYVNPVVPSTDPDLARCLRVTTAHELGHSLGIFQHSPDANDLMFCPAGGGSAQPARHQHGPDAVSFSARHGAGWSLTANA